MATDTARQQALALFETAVQAADPARAVDRYFAAQPLDPIDGVWHVIALGKAGCSMTRAALAHLPVGARRKALAITNPENAADIQGAEVIAAGHPVPDENSARAGRAVVNLLKNLSTQDRVLALISGGGSALMTAPVQGVSDAEKAQVSAVLLQSGFDINRMNLVRQHLSRLKGGGLARLAGAATVQALILSDVVGDDLRVIASGPTVGPVGTRAEALALLKSHNVLPQLPESVQRFFQQPEGRTAPPTNAINTIIGSNRQSLDAMQKATKFAQIVDDSLTGDVAKAAEQIISAGHKAGSGPKTLLFGGETTVQIRGSGLGGRNQELALRVALQLDQLDGNWLFLSGGTDGRDGPTDAAGGIVDAGTVARMRARGLEPERVLENNDSYHGLLASGDLIKTGGTGTNVADVQVLLRL